LVGFERWNQTLVWNAGYFIVRIEPRWASSPHIRTFENAEIREDLLHVLIDPRSTTNFYTLKNGVSPCRKTQTFLCWM
jgi:hypothetical protein